MIMVPFYPRPLPVQALTFSEIIKLLDVSSRYLQDLQRTFPERFGDPNSNPPVNNGNQGTSDVPSQKDNIPTDFYTPVPTSQPTNNNNWFQF
jgi:hypothetical protein